MKRFKHSLKATSLFFMAVFCCLHATYAQDSKKEKDSIKAAAVKVMVDAKDYVLQVLSVSPMKGGSRQLSTGYTLKVSKDTIVSDLPYYGRAYQASFSSEGGIKFTSTDFVYSTANRKKGGWDVTIKPKDAKNFQELRLTIFENGSASLNVTCNDRQPISYNGDIEERKQK